MARTNRRSAAVGYKKTARDGASRNWTMRGRRQRGEKAAHNAARQAWRHELAIEQGEEERRALLDAREADRLANEDAWDRMFREFREQEARDRARLVEEYGEHSEEVYMFDNPAYAKWKERQWEAENIAA